MHDFTVTPYSVEGAVDYDRLLDQFGADALTDEQLSDFPQPPHPLLRRGVFYAGRDVERFTSAANRDETVSVVTGRGPSGPMHLGHVLPFYFAKWLQAETGAYVYVPLSDDEKYFAKDLDFEEIHEHTRENLRDLVAVGFDPERTRFVVDTADSDVIYPLAAEFAKDITPATVEATYGDPPNVGLGFYPAVQATHLLLPQLLYGRHPTLVPIAVDQDPHIRVCRDIAGKQRYDVEKPGALLSKFLPRLGGGGGKMSSSGDEPTIYLMDDRETVHEKVSKYAFSGGRADIDEHREKGGDPDADVAYQLLFSFFEEDDETVERLAREYRAGELLSGEMKQYAAGRIADFLEMHQSRRPEGSIRDAVEPYRLTDAERARLRPDVFGAE
ncbi:tryptophan--tRNA ligase [Haloprofundus salilacus]|uniref:tryptophan--tRNA ligase n=1 Tax=Haloprofundus salilacus TaxID=2876190 RepID=UPI001CCFB057|nr:tryptophan--tRNA ligase [Haloprofundus salilacus]